MSEGNALVVDDLAMIQRLLQRQLEKKGWKCLAASDHEQAVQILTENDDIQCVFLDYNIKAGLDTPRFIRHLKTIRPDLRIIGISGQDCGDEFASQGVSEFLMKPWGSEDLDRLLQKTTQSDNGKRPQ